MQSADLNPAIARANPKELTENRARTRGELTANSLNTTERMNTMSLWDGLKKAGSAAYGSATERARKIQEYMDKYDCYDDDRLKDLYRNSTGDKKIAITKLLRQRGYGD